MEGSIIYEKYSMKFTSISCEIIIFVGEPMYVAIERVLAMTN